jgi:hypothetical protein
MATIRENIRKAQDHINRHRKLYAAGTIGFLAGYYKAKNKYQVDTPPADPHANPLMPGVYTFPNEDAQKEWLEYYFPKNMERQRKTERETTPFMGGLFN